MITSLSGLRSPALYSARGATQSPLADVYQRATAAPPAAAPPPPAAHPVRGPGDWSWGNAFGGAVTGAVLGAIPVLGAFTNMVSCMGSAYNAVAPTWEPPKSKARETVGQFLGLGAGLIGGLSNLAVFVAPHPLTAVAISAGLGAVAGFHLGGYLWDFSH